MGREENLMPAWEKGQSGNPNGRPKGAKSRSSIARKWLETNGKFIDPETGQELEISHEDAITLALIKKAKEGDTAAYKALMDSGYGLPKQEVEQTNININSEPLNKDEIEDISDKLDENV